jgi:hypothetical protein
MGAGQAPSHQRQRDDAKNYTAGSRAKRQDLPQQKNRNRQPITLDLSVLPAEIGVTAHELMGIFGWLTLRRGTQIVLGESAECRPPGVSHRLILLKNLPFWRPVGEPCTAVMAA